jgi:hypothetical protein
MVASEPTQWATGDTLWRGSEGVNEVGEPGLLQLDEFFFYSFHRLLVKGLIL